LKAKVVWGGHCGPPLTLSEAEIEHEIVGTLVSDPPTGFRRDLHKVRMWGQPPPAVHRARLSQIRGTPEEIKKPGLIGAGLGSGVANNG
jgi:hypothetical protein